MHYEEACWFGARLPLAYGQSPVVLNIGSSTQAYRSIEQPHIDEQIFRVLEERGFNVLHVDRKAAAGVDIVGDLSDAGLAGRLAQLNPHAVFCNNLFMHLREKAVPQVIATIDALVPSGRLLYLSSSSRYPYTPDPYDNGFRPAADGLAALFPGYEIVDAEIVGTSRTFIGDLRRDWKLAIIVATRAFVPFYKPRSWYSLIRYLPSINKPYETACVVLRKT